MVAGVGKVCPPDPVARELIEHESRYKVDLGPREIRQCSSWSGWRKRRDSKRVVSHLSLSRSARRRTGAVTGCTAAGHGEKMRRELRRALRCHTETAPADPTETTAQRKISSASRLRNRPTLAASAANTSAAVCTQTGEPISNGSGLDCVEPRFAGWCPSTYSRTSTN